MEIGQEVSGTVAGRGIVAVNEEAIRNHLDERVRGTVDETLDRLLDAVADELCGAKRYERFLDRSPAG